MVTLKLTREQAAAVRSVLNMSGVPCEHIDAVSVGAAAASHLGMAPREMERTIQRVWEALEKELGPQVAESER